MSPKLLLAKYLMADDATEGVMEETKKPLGRGLIQLAGAIFGVYLLSFYILPTITASSPSIQKLADFIDYEEIDTGMFFYTDLEIVGHADIGARSTIEYFGNK
ncbi:MAG: hypothetical protein OCC45_05450 [Desulfotalea sp.]